MYVVWYMSTTMYSQGNKSLRLLKKVIRERLVVTSLETLTPSIFRGAEGFECF